MSITIAVIGLGYVGLPLAVEFGKKFKTLGFDLSAEKVAAYGRHVDPTGEVSTEDLRAASAVALQHRPGRHRRGRFHRRCRAHAGGRRAPARFHAAGEVARRASAGT